MSALAGDLKGESAVLVVGHQPGLSWLSDEFTRPRGLGHLWRWTAGPVPIDLAEVVCLKVRSTSKTRWRGHVTWTVHPDDTKALESITAKVRSKMESAKLLSGVITLALTALLGVLLDRGKWQTLQGCTDSVRPPTGPPQCLDVVPFGVTAWSFGAQVGLQIVFGLLLLALVLFLFAMYGYDTLLMPPRFWAEAPAAPRPGRARRLTSGGPRRWLPRRPPSSSAWVVYRNMMRIWYRLFTPAVACVVVAFLLLTATLLRLSARGYGVLLLSVILLAAYRSWFKPALGSED